MKPHHGKAILVKFNTDNVRAVGQLVQLAFTGKWKDVPPFVVCCSDTDFKVAAKLCAADVGRIILKNSGSDPRFLVRATATSGKARFITVPIYMRNSRGDVFRTEEEFTANVHDRLVAARKQWNSLNSSAEFQYSGELLA